MKNNILTSLAVFCGLALGPGRAMAAATCIDCTLQFTVGGGSTGECERYNSLCCPPCNMQIDPIDPVICDESTCSGTTVTDMGGGCDKVETKGCNGNVCKTTTTARCQKGYYGSPSIIFGTSCSGCTRCPSSGGVYGTTAGVGAILEKECYMPSGTYFSDEAGSGIYMGNCYYL